MTNWNIVEEKYLQNFGNSNFRTQGLFYLAEINGILQYKLWELTGTAPLCVHPSTARSLLSLKPTENRADTKAEVLRYVQQVTGTEISWPKKRRNEGFAEECYDMADAYVLARYALVRDHAKQMLLDAEISDDLRKSLHESSLFLDFVKIHIAHFAQKYCVDAKMDHLDTIPLPLLEVSGATDLQCRCYGTNWKNGPSRRWDSIMRKSSNWRNLESFLCLLLEHVVTKGY